VNIVYGRELTHTVRQAEAAEMEKGEGPLSEERKAEVLAEARAARVHEFREQFANPYIAAERGYVDAVILPHETRRRLITALEMLDGKRDRNPPKKHGNIPL
jgi:propionyl-CoA carboxylase beta chain